MFFKTYHYNFVYIKCKKSHITKMVYTAFYLEMCNVNLIDLGKYFLTAFQRLCAANISETADNGLRDIGLRTVTTDPLPRHDQALFSPDTVVLRPAEAVRGDAHGQAAVQKNAVA